MTAADMIATRRLVIVGNGMAGSRLVHELRRRDLSSRWQVTVIGDEPHAAYNRVLLSNVLAGTASASSIHLAAPKPSSDDGVEVRTGVAVVDIDRVARVVTTDDGRQIPYDVLVLATGSTAVVPPIDGLRTQDGSLVEGAAVFRTLDDCDRILELARNATRAVVLGGGSRCRRRQFARRWRRGAPVRRPGRGTYKKVVIRDGRITGAILLGDVTTAGPVMQLFDRGGVVPPDRLTLLFAGMGSSDATETPARIPDRATVCRCNGVTKGAITACWLAGARTAEDVALRTRATTGCGTCRDTVEGIVDWLAASATEPRTLSQRV